MSDPVPPGFRPMDELTADSRGVELALRTGSVVPGMMITGVPSPQARTYWCQGAWNVHTGRHDMVPVYPIGWREPHPSGLLRDTRWR